MSFHVVTEPRCSPRASGLNCWAISRPLVVLKRWYSTFLGLALRALMWYVFCLWNTLTYLQNCPGVEQDNTDWGNTRVSRGQCMGNSEDAGSAKFFLEKIFFPRFAWRFPEILVALLGCIPSMQITIWTEFRKSVKRWRAGSIKGALGYCRRDLCWIWPVCIVYMYAIVKELKTKNKL